MNFVVVTNEWLSEHGIMPLPTMRKSKDGSKIIMHEDYLKPYMREEESEVDAENPNGWLPSERYPHNSSKLNELLQSEEWAYSEEDAPTESSDFIQVAAVRNLMTATKAGIQEMSLTDEEALEVKDMYPEWGGEGAEMGKQVEAGFKLRNTGVLYKALQPHTLQAEWEPGAQGTEALYAVVSANADEEHAGTLEDPIPYVQNMPIEEGKYYTQYGVTYIGILTTLTGYPQDLKDMPSVAMPVE